MHSELIDEPWVIGTRRGTKSVHRSDYTSVDEYFGSNAYELTCLVEAEDGDIGPLAQYISEFGYLATEEAREFVRRRLLGLPAQIGRRRTLTQQAYDVHVYCEIRRIQEEKKCTEYRASQLYLDDHPDTNPETLKSTIKRAKKTLEHYFGRKPTPPKVG